MKRSLIALGVAAAVALPVVANAAPTLYGKLNVSVEDYKQTFSDPAKAEVDTSRMVSNASRIGVKGDADLGDDLSVIYQIEWEVTANDGNGAVSGKSTDLYQRDRFLGLKSKDFGTLKLGKFDSYNKQAQGSIDLFNDYEGDMKYVIAGENRLANSVGYESPKFFDALTINVEAQTQQAANDNASQTAGKNGSSASIVYSNKDMGLYAALGADFGVMSGTALSGTRESDNMRAVLAYSVSDLTLNGIYATSEDSTNTTANKDKETGWQFGASYKIGSEVLKAQYGEAKADNSAASTQKHTLWSVGVDHNFNSATKAYVWYTDKKEDKLVALNNSEVKDVAVGLEYKF